MDDPVQIRLKYHPADDLPPGEWMWAQLLESGVGSGVFELQNSSFFVPLVAGDVVRAERDAEDDYQITDVVRAGPRTMTVVHLDGRDCDVEVVTARWAAQGALWTEGMDGWMLTVWESPIETVGEVLRPDVRAGYATWEITSTPDERGRTRLPEVDFEISRSRSTPHP